MRCVRRHETRKTEIAVHSRGSVDEKPHARIAALKSIIGRLEHLYAVDVDRNYVSNYAGLDHIPIGNSVLRTANLFYVAKLAQASLPPSDIAVGLRRLCAPEHDFIAGGVVGGKGTPQAQLHFLPDLAVLVLINRVDGGLDRLVRPPGSRQYRRGIIIFLWFRSRPADLGPKGKTWLCPDVGPIKTVLLAV